VSIVAVIVDMRKLADQVTMHAKPMLWLLQQLASGSLCNSDPSVNDSCCTAAAALLTRTVVTSANDASRVPFPRICDCLSIFCYATCVPAGPHTINEKGSVSALHHVTRHAPLNHKWELK
jgi:hypothetical protein